jgi:hypothetical protein
MARAGQGRGPDPEVVLAVAEQHLRRLRGYLTGERASN